MGSGGICHETDGNNLEGWRERDGQSRPNTEDDRSWGVKTRGAGGYCEPTHGSEVGGAGTVATAREEAGESLESLPNRPDEDAQPLPVALESNRGLLSGFS